MSNLKLLRTILRLKSLKITDFRFLQRGTELHLAVKPYKNGCRCPECGRRGRIVHQPAEPRRWEDVAVLGLRLVLWYAPKEIRCPTHGRVQEEIPWAPASAGASVINCYSGGQKLFPTRGAWRPARHHPRDRVDAY